MTHRQPYAAPLAVRGDWADLALHSLAQHAARPAVARSGTAPGMRRCATPQGVAIIPVQGLLVARLGALQPMGDMTGYDGIRQNLMMALDDPAVRAVMFDIDSFGGEVVGLFDLADTIYSARGMKPMWAVLNDSAYSAAYAIASACDHITVPRTGGTGSVGILDLHTDLSGALEQAGIGVTLIQHGARKADGVDSAPLSDPAREAMQGDVNTMGRLFVRTVARNRRLPVAAVRRTEAATFMGAASVEIGFADAVMPPDEAFRGLLASLGPITGRSARRRTARPL